MQQRTVTQSPSGRMIWSLILPTALFCLLLWGGWFDSPWEFHSDEGLNLIKGHLINRGFVLYDEIWSDQPALTSVLISIWIDLFGRTLMSIRLLFFASSALLLFCFHQILLRDHQAPVPFLCTLLLTLSPYYIRLSSSVMIGLPALALAVWSVYLLIDDREDEPQAYIWLAVSAGVMAFAAQMKLYVVILFPAVALYLLLTTFSKQQRSDMGWALIVSLRKPAFWGIAWLIFYLVLSLVVGQRGIDDVFFSHFAGGDRDNRAVLGIPNFDITIYNLAFLVTGLFGLLYAGWDRRPTLALPATWACGGLLFIYYHTPTWEHHLPILNVPLIWLGAYGFARCFEYAGQLLRRELPFRPAILNTLIAGFVVTLLLVTVPSPLPSRLRNESRLYPIALSTGMVEYIKTNTDPDAFVFSDRPLYLFLTNRSMPPELGVISIKRISNGNIDEDELLTILATYQPEVIVLERYVDQRFEQYDLGPFYTDKTYRYLDEHYNPLVMADGAGQYFELKPESRSATQ